MRSSSRIVVKSKARIITSVSKFKPALKTKIKHTRKVSSLASPSSAKRSKTIKSQIIIFSDSESSDENNNAFASSTIITRKIASKDKAVFNVKSAVDYISTMTVKDREAVFRIFGIKRTTDYAGRIGFVILEHIKYRSALLPTYMAKHHVRVPSNALDWCEKKGLKDKIVIEQWRQSERTPSPGLMPCTSGGTFFLPLLSKHLVASLFQMLSMNNINTELTQLSSC